MKVLLSRFVSAPVLAVLALFACTPSALAQDQLDLPADPLAAVGKMPVQEPVKDGQRVEVVDENGKPLAGVSVVVVVGVESFGREKMRAWQTQAVEKYKDDREKVRTAFFVALGKRFVTGANGSVMVSKLEQSGALMVVQGENTALSTGRQAVRDVIRVVLRPDLPIHILVLGPKGRPVQGVRVGLTTNLEYSHGMAGAVKTDKAGRAQLRWGEYRNYQVGQKLYVRVMAATRKPVAQEVDHQTFKNDAEHPIKLTLPNYGQVRVYVVDKNDKPVRGIDGATLAIRRSGDRFGRSRGRFEADSVDDDSATFAVVEVGLPVELSCRYKGSTRPQKVQSDGPRHYMDMRIVKIAGVAAPKRVRCRVLGLDGEPVLNEELGVIFIQGGRFDGTTATTDGKGHLDIVVPNQFAALEEGRFCVVRRFAGSSRKAAFLGTKQLSFEFLREHSQDLGDVRLEPEKIVVAGQVVDNHGTPVAGAQVTVADVHGQFNSWGRSGSREFYECRTVTDASGRFELRAADNDLRLVKMSVLAQGYVQDSDNRDLEADVGTKNAKIVLLRASTIYGQFVGLKVRNFGGEIRLIDKDGKDTRQRAHAIEGSTFRFENCPPGEYSVEFKLSMAEEAILTVPGIKVEEGKPCKDPRLMAVDLSEHARIVKVTVLGSDKKPLRQASVRYHVVRGRRRSSQGYSTDSNGVCELLLPLAGGNVSVQDRNGEYRSQRFPMLKKDIVVQLEESLVVTVQLKGMPKLPDNLSFRLYAEMKGREARRLANDWGLGSRYRRSQPVLDAKGRAELLVPEPGDYALTLTPALTSNGGRKTRYLNQGRPSLDFTIKKPEEEDAKAQVVEIVLAENDLEVIKDLIELAKESKEDGRDR